MTQTLVRTKRDDATPVRPRRLVMLGWLVVLVGTVAVGSAFLRSDPNQPTASTADGPVQVAGGLLRIDGAQAEEATHLPMAMPGMTHEPIGEGNFLLRLDVTLGAVDRAIDYRPEDFTVSGGNFDAVEPYRAVAGPGRIFTGMTAPLLLVYEVPADGGPFLFRYGGEVIELVGFVAPAGAEHDDH